MSRSLNKAQLIGNVGSDPEVRGTSNGGRVATFSLATSRQWTTPSGEKSEKTEWHRLVAWNQGKGTLADIVERFVKKGERVYVEGEIEYRQWTDKEGQTRYTTEIRVQELILLGGKAEGAAAPQRNDRPDARPTVPVKQPKTPKVDDFSDFPAALEDEDEDGLPF